MFWKITWIVVLVVNALAIAAVATQYLGADNDNARALVAFLAIVAIAFVGLINFCLGVAWWLSRHTGDNE